MNPDIVNLFGGPEGFAIVRFDWIYVLSNVITITTFIQPIYILYTAHM